MNGRLKGLIENSNLSSRHSETSKPLSVRTAETLFFYYSIVVTTESLPQTPIFVIPAEVEAYSRDIALNQT